MLGLQWKVVDVYENGGAYYIILDFSSSCCLLIRRLPTLPSPVFFKLLDRFVVEDNRLGYGTLHGAGIGDEYR